MKNFIQEGESLELTAPVGGVVAGKAYLIGAIIVIANISAAAGAKFTGSTKGVYKFVKDTALVLAEGAEVKWDIETGTVVATGDVAGDFVLGYVTEAVGAGVLSVNVKIKAV